MRLATYRHIDNDQLMVALLLFVDDLECCYMYCLDLRFRQLCTRVCMCVYVCIKNLHVASTTPTIVSSNIFLLSESNATTYSKYQKWMIISTNLNIEIIIRHRCIIVNRVHVQRTSIGNNTKRVCARITRGNCIHRNWTILSPSTIWLRLSNRISRHCQLYG
jgi:hypothetical protein